MPRPLPPLNALRAFEAAARHLSFTKAAEELCVTPAAIGHHIRSLEDHLGFALFTRKARRLALTEYGQALLPIVQDSFNQIAMMVERLRRESGHSSLSLRLPPYFSAWWLTPRLGNFLRAYPDIQLHLEHSVEPVDFGSGRIDLAIHWRGLDAPGVIAEPLVTSPRVPMCSARLLAGAPPLRKPEDIHHFTLLHEFDHADWEQWFEFHGLDPAGARRGIIVDNYEVLFRTAIQGQGIALLIADLYPDQIADARLLSPLGQDSGCTFTYYVLYLEAALTRPVVRAFHDWIFDQVAQSRSGKPTPP